MRDCEINYSWNRVTNCLTAYTILNFDRLLCVSITFEGNGIHTLSAYYLMYICLPEILHQLNSRGV